MYAILLKKDGDYTVLNTFHMGSTNALLKAKRAMQQWYDTYFRDIDAHLVLATAEQETTGAGIRNIKEI